MITLIYLSMSFHSIIYTLCGDTFLSMEIGPSKSLPCSTTLGPFSFPLASYWSIITVFWLPCLNLGVLSKDFWLSFGLRILFFVLGLPWLLTSSLSSLESARLPYDLVMPRSSWSLVWFLSCNYIAKYRSGLNGISKVSRDIFENLDF